MIQNLVRLYALKLGQEFETALTKKRGYVIDKGRNVSDEGIMVNLDGVTRILHNEIRVRPVTVVH